MMQEEEAQLNPLESHIQIIFIERAICCTVSRGLHNCSFQYINITNIVDYVPPGMAFMNFHFHRWLKTSVLYKTS